MELLHRVPQAVFDRWLAAAVLADARSDALLLAVPPRLAPAWLHARFGETLQAAASAPVGRRVRVDLWAPRAPVTGRSLGDLFDTSTDDDEEEAA